MKVLRLIIVGAFSVSSLCSMAAAQDEVIIDLGRDGLNSQQIVLPEGKAAIIQLPRNASDVLVSDPEVIETVIRTPRRIYILGREVGQANAFFFDSNNNEILSLDVRVEFDVSAVQDTIERLIPDARVEVETLNTSVLISGQVDSAVEAQRIEDLVNRYFGVDNTVSMLSVREPGQVMLRVRIVEMERRLIRQLGIDLNGVARISDAAVDFAVQNSFALSGGSLGGLSGSAVSPGFGGIDGLDIAFDAFEQNGLVKTLAEPNLTAMSGHAANFLAGGEFPVPTFSADGVPTVEFKEFGVQLNFRPHVYSEGRIQLNIMTEVSDVSEVNGISLASTAAGGLDVDDDGGTSSDGFIIPGVRTRMAETTVELPSGGSFAIAGLLQENISDFVDGVPGLKDTPVLGQLFRSQEFQSSQSELVVIVTPYLVEPTDLANLTDPARGHISPSAVESLLLGQLEAAYGVAGNGVSETTLQGPVGFILD